MARLFLALLLLVPRLALAGCGPIAMGEPRLWLTAAAEPSLRITFLGHASFLLETPAGCERSPITAGFSRPPTRPTW